MPSRSIHILCTERAGLRIITTCILFKYLSYSRDGHISILRLQDKKALYLLCNVTEIPFLPLDDSENGYNDRWFHSNRHDCTSQDEEQLFAQQCRETFESSKVLHDHLKHTYNLYNGNTNIHFFLISVHCTTLPHGIDQPKFTRQCTQLQQTYDLLTMTSSQHCLQGTAIAYIWKLCCLKPPCIGHRSLHSAVYGDFHVPLACTSITEGLTWFEIWRL